MNEKYNLEELAPWFVIILTLIGYVLRILLLAGKGLWLEETFSVWVASHSTGEVLQWVAKIDQHPPLYYLLLHYWIEINDDKVYTVRLLSVLFSTATIPMIFLIGKRLSSVEAGLAAAALLTLSPFNIRYAQEARMYSLLLFNASVAIYALVRLLTDSRATRPIGSQFRDYLKAWRTSAPVEPEMQDSFSYKHLARKQTGWRGWVSRHYWSPVQSIETDLAWIAFMVFTAATLLSHNSAVLFLLAANIFVLGLMLFQRIKKSEAAPSLQAPSFWNWFLSQVGIFILLIPWFTVYSSQIRRLFPAFWFPEQVLDTLNQMLRTFVNETLPSSVSQSPVIWILFAVVGCLGVVYFRNRIARFIFLATLFAVPLVVLFVKNDEPDYLVRTLIWITIPLFLVIGSGIAQLRYRLVIVVVLGIFAIYNIFSTGDYYRFVQKEDWSSPAGFVANFVRKDDLVLFNAPWAQIPFDYYFESYEDQYFIEVEKHGAPVDMFDSGILEPMMTENDVPRLKSLLSEHKRVFLISSQASNTDPKGLIPQTLASGMKLFLTRDYNGVQVQWYEAP